MISNIWYVPGFSACVQTSGMLRESKTFDIIIDFRRTDNLFLGLIERIMLE